ncbi:hypothetical protein K493DRAFT_301732 [Basidiobolus meristosporus CBS 931.73]|uniref:RGS domain-containing protein n=1 Tax=Basidiobolus meristosporus CBS 931.73 TaxID=1314790 RepID=A0A1Y1YAJ3_9FUNG|nr:hypothetical protein K493DRAFT_301732 [Basidiobolus meristosporus CBS 931.73]|eukprot:ORX94983.1 hypothetical protein K493DRAFT_301732 [Basidiobolus meristosporus CBS 931.73]
MVFQTLGQNLACVALVLHFTIVIVTTILFLYNRHKFNHRPHRLILLGAIGNLIISGAYYCRLIFWMDFSCTFVLWGTYLGSALYFLPFMARGIQLLVVVKFNTAKVHGQLQDTFIDDKNSFELMEHETYRHSHISRQAYNKERVTDKKLTFLVALFIFIMIAAISVMQLVRMLEPGFDEYTLCGFGWHYFPFFGMTGLFLFICCPLVIYFFWNVKDAYGLRNELITCVFLGLLIYPMYFVWTLVLKEQLNSSFSSYYFITLFMLLSHLNTVGFPLISLAYRARKLRSIAAYDSEHFHRIFENPEMLHHFRSFAARYLCSENTCFIDDFQLLKQYCIMTAQSGTKSSSFDTPLVSTKPISIFKSRPPAITPAHIGIGVTIRKYTDKEQVPDDLHVRFLKFYRTYIQTGALLEVNISSNVHTSIFRQIQEGHIKWEIFDDAKDQILSLLYDNVFPDFVQNYMRRKSIA